MGVVLVLVWSSIETKIGKKTNIEEIDKDTEKHLKKNNKPD